MNYSLLQLPHTSHVMYGLETDGVDVFENLECGLQGSLPLVCGLCGEHSFAATHHNLRSLPGSRCLLWRYLCSCRPSFWVLFRAFGLMPLLVHIYCHGEHEVRDDVSVVTGGLPGVYCHLSPCIRPWGNFSCSYSSMDAMASPRRWGKET